MVKITKESVIMYYFTRITFNTFTNMKKLAQELYQNSYLEHQLLWQLFDSDSKAKRDFLYRQTVEQGRTKYYILSKRKPMDKKDIWHIDQPKVYKPQLKAGQTLYFMLRANPVVFSPDKKRRRYDVVQHAKKTMDYSNLSWKKKLNQTGFEKGAALEVFSSYNKDLKPEKSNKTSIPMQSIIQDSCFKWLKAKANSNGFAVDKKEVIVDGYRQHKIYKKNIIYSSVDFHGFLTVDDPETLKSSLVKGIGKSKAFGCGLLLIKKHNRI